MPNLMEISGLLRGGLRTEHLCEALGQPVLSAEKMLEIAEKMVAKGMRGLAIGWAVRAERKAIEEKKEHIAARAREIQRMLKAQAVVQAITGALNEEFLPDVVDELDAGVIHRDRDRGDLDMAHRVLEKGYKNFLEKKYGPAVLRAVHATRLAAFHFNEDPARAIRLLIGARMLAWSAANRRSQFWK